jgi:hypothetical protein
VQNITIHIKQLGFFSGMAYVKAGRDPSINNQMVLRVGWTVMNTFNYAANQ